MLLLLLYGDECCRLLQTSCCVNAGASGGPLLSQSGRLLGIAVCNARYSYFYTDFFYDVMCN
jgi:hypothetical protein